MLRYVNSALFSSPARVLVNTVNTVGVMGKGIALEFKQRYPDMYERYRDLCKRTDLEVGKLWLWKAPDRWILNFPTKKHWRNPSKPEYITAGLRKFASTYEELGIESISFPLLGCGNGGLDFETQVRPIMERYLKHLTIAVYIHLRTEPQTFVPEHDEPDLFAATAPREFDEFWSHLRQLAERNPELQTLEMGAPFRLAYVTDENIVFFRRSEDKVHIPRSDIHDLWISLTYAGSISPAEAPGRVGREYGLVFAFLALLPYVEPIRLADDYHTFKARPPFGIQLNYYSGSMPQAVEVEYA